MTILNNLVLKYLGLLISVENFSNWKVVGDRESTVYNLNKYAEVA